MSHSRVYLDYLRDMLISAEKAVEFVGAMNYEQFAKDEKTIYAVVRALEIIGEAARKIPEDMRKTYPDIPWREIAGTRDKLIHEYFGVNLKVVWRTVQDDLPILVKQLRKTIDESSNFSE